MGIWRERESNMQKGKDLWGLERRGGEGGREKPASGFVLDAEPPISLLLAALPHRLLPQSISLNAQHSQIS
jgi:hypothetical protein